MIVGVHAPQLVDELSDFVVSPNELIPWHGATSNLQLGFDLSDYFIGSPVGDRAGIN